MIHVEAKPVHYHNCPALGPQTKIIRATMLSKDGSVVLGCTTAGDFECAPGVTQLPDGTYTVDMSVAIKPEAAA